MRYLLLTYYKKPDGRIDEVMAVAKNLKNRDLQTCSVILDFRNLTVIKCSLSGTNVPKDFDRITGYYHEHYAATIDRLFDENGWEVEVNESKPQDQVD